MMRRRVSSRNIGKYTLFIASVLSLLFSIVFYSINGLFIAESLLLVSTIFLTFFSSSKNLFHISFLSGHYAFWVMPFIITSYAGLVVSYIPLFYCMAGVVFVIGLADKMGDVDWIENKTFSISPILFSAIYIFAFLLMLITKGFVMPLMGILVVSAALTMQKEKFVTTSLVYASLVFYIAVYSVFFWGGFARLVLVGFFMTITFMYLICINFSVFIKPLVIFVVPFGAILGSFFRFDVFTFEDAVLVSVEDSTVTPYVLMGRIYDVFGGSSVNNFGGWFDQVLLFFFSVFPRVWWESKPNGFGFQYTVDNLSQYLVDAGHSVAALFIGENIYYLGSVFGIIGTLVSLSFILILYRIFCMKSIFGGYGVFVMALWMPTYYWGGMQAFSARFLMSAIPLVFLFFLHKAYLMVKMRRTPVRQIPVRRRV